MTRILNDPESFAEQQLAGFADLYADRLSAVTGGIVGHRGADPIVAVIVGGGSGHYPAFAGLVGPGLAAGAAVGNVFTSPSAAHIVSVARAAERGRGVILALGNYAGDEMNARIAADRLRAEGIDTRILLVTDDVASATEPGRRRGIAGGLAVFKVLGAAAAAGASIDEVERLGRTANAATRTLGVAFSGCTLPGDRAPLFSISAGAMGLGLGIHGEPGIRETRLVSARDLARLLVEGVLAEAPDGAAGTARFTEARVAPIVNGLGATGAEELFLLWGEIRPLLDRAGLIPIEPELGEFVTSLDMEGCSLSLMWLDGELEGAWRADAYAPGFRRRSSALSGLRPAPAPPGFSAERSTPPPIHSPSPRGGSPSGGSPSGPGTGAAALAGVLATALASARNALREAEPDLGRLDAIAGDGDHGRGMLRGAAAAARGDRTRSRLAAGRRGARVGRGGRGYLRGPVGCGARGGRRCPRRREADLYRPRRARGCRRLCRRGCGHRAGLRRG